MGEIIQAPEGVEIGLSFYFTSEETGLEVVGNMSGLPALTSFDGQADAAKLAEHFGLNSFADDWRLMTRAEIADYKRREREGEDD